MHNVVSGAFDAARTRLEQFRLLSYTFVRLRAVSGFARTCSKVQAGAQQCTNMHEHDPNKFGQYW
eukprot:9186235-Alexandrium_andersonii.AAC.1